ncbi:hypothetical protein ACFLTU_07175 [Bacteroidota bacterium]
MRRISAKIQITIIVLLIGACTRSVVPPGNYAPLADDVETDLYGCWTELQLQSSGTRDNNPKYAGELIAIHNDSLFLLTLSNSLHIFSVSEIKELKLVHYEYNTGNLFIYGGVAFLPNLLGMAIHTEYAGGFLFFGLYSIIGAGLGTLINITSYKIIKYPGVDNQNIQGLRKYSRFPQGISNTINPYSLEAKKIWMSH